MRPGEGEAEVPPGNNERASPVRQCPGDKTLPPEDNASGRSFLSRAQRIRHESHSPAVNHTGR